MTVHKTLEGRTLTLAPEGRVDTVNAPQLEREVRDGIDGIEELIFDLGKLEYISSAGLRVLLFAQKTMNRQGRLTVIDPCRGVMALFEATGFSDVLTIVNKPASEGAAAEERPATLR